MTSSSFDNFVTSKEAIRLSPTLRIAWLSTIWEQVLALYSPWFRRTYCQDQALDYAWTYAETSVVNTQSVVRLIDEMQDLLENADDDNYSADPVWPGILVLSEILDGDAKNAIQAIDYLSLAFGAHHLYRQGICPFDPQVPQEYHFALSEPVYLLARKLYDEFITSPPQVIRRHLIRSEQLPASFPSLPLEVVASKSTVPPQAEVDHLRSTLSTNH